MKRGAIVFAVSSAALLLSCTQDFDALIGPELSEVTGDEDDDDAGNKPASSSSSSGAGGGTSSGDPPSKALACGEPVVKCAIDEVPGDVEFTKSCTGCGCQCGTLQCSPTHDDCDLSCRGGSECATLCDADHCSLTTEGSSSKSTCTAFTCDVLCTQGSRCLVDCSETSSCTVNVDATSTAVVTCGKGSCVVTCAKSEAKKCPDGTRACGECPG